MDAAGGVVGSPLWPWFALAAVLILACVELAAALYIARSASALGAARHEERCTKRHEEVADDFRKLRREYASFADDTTADLEASAGERARAQAARARAAKAEKHAEAVDAGGLQAAPLETRDAFRRRMRTQRYGAA